MPVFSSRERRILFIHIPKTGGTSIEKFFLENGFSMSLFAPRPHRCMKVHPQHLTSGEVRYLLGDDFDYEFAVVRDPFDRLESEFFYANKLRSMRKEPPIADEGFAEWVREALEQARSRPYFRDAHFRPQSQFVGAATRIFRYEDGLAQAVERVFEENNIPMKGALAAHNKSNRRDLSWTCEALDMVRAFYAEDFRCFGYSGHAGDCG